MGFVPWVQAFWELLRFGPPSAGEGRRLSGTLVLALGLNEALPVGFCDEALPDALLPVDTEVEAIRLSGRR